VRSHITTTRPQTTAPLNTLNELRVTGPTDWLFAERERLAPAHQEPTKISFYMLMMAVSEFSDELSSS
jgi:hypothetical protein